MWLRVFLSLVVTSTLADKPCASRLIAGQSPVCVCNVTYCDEITRAEPEKGSFVAYTSSEKGLRFHKTVGHLQDHDDSVKSSYTLKFHPSVTYQTVEGFGGAVTDSAGINWKSLPEILQDKLIETYFGPTGIEYSFIRVPIGGCDFSTRIYTYNDLPKDDINLKNYTLAPEDHLYKIPMIKAAMRISKTPVHVIGTTWSPPIWMKSNDKITGSSRLLREYYQTYADYYLKFLQAYDKEGVPVWAITTTNEPFNGLVPIAKFNSLGWTPEQLGQWIDENLGPTIKGSPFNNTKILTGDDQRFTIPIWFNWVIKERPTVLNWIDGIAVHFYADFLTPASVLDLVTKHHSNKFLIGTEACEGAMPYDEKVVLGSWSRARNYIHDIIEDLNHDFIGWIDWNLCLNPHGGPNWEKNFVDSPVIIFKETKEFVKQPMYYALGHFSKFVPRGSKRIKMDHIGGCMKTVESVTFRTPRGTLVAVIHNECHGHTAKLIIGKKEAVINLPEKSITTIEIKP